MARIPEGKQRLGIGCHCTMTPASRGFKMNINLTMKWYAWPFIMWKAAHKDYHFKWLQYPRLLCIIAKGTIQKWVGK